MSAPLVVPAVGKHTATVIMAHGLGDTGHGWISLAENWRRRGKFQDVKFIFPHAPNIPITVNFGMRMPGWHDITTFSELSSDQDITGVQRSRNILTDLIVNESQSTSIPTSRIILGGFSQGGAMSIFTLLTTPHKLCGVFGLSSYLPLADTIHNYLPAEKGVNHSTPVFLGHGDSDPLVKYEWGKRTADEVRNLGFQDVEFKTYRNLEHSAAVEEIDDLEQFITKCLAQDSGETTTTAALNTAAESSGSTNVGNPGL